MGLLNGKATAADSYVASDGILRDQAEKRRVAEFQARREEAELVRCVYDGTFAVFVDRALRSRYHPDTYAALKIAHGIQTHNNVLRDVVEKLAVAWQDGARWALVDAEGTDHPDADGALASFLRAAEMDALGRRIDVLTELHRTVAVAPTVAHQPRTERRAFRWAVHTPESFNLIPSPGDPQDFAAIEVYGEMRDKAGVTRECKTAWSSDEYVRFVKGARGTWEEVERAENPYRTIPYVLVRGSPSVVGGLWGEAIGPQLAELTVEANAWETVLGYQGSGQIKVLAGQFKDFPQGQALRHAGVISLGQAESLSLLDYQTDVEGFARTFIGRLRAQAAAAVGLSTDEFTTTGTPPSGEALKMRYWARDRRAIAKRPLLRQALSELFWMAQHVLSYQLRVPDEPPVVGIDRVVPYDADNFDTRGLRLVIDPEESSYPELAAEQQAREEYDLRMGMTNRAEMYARRNPDASREEAERAVLTNLALEARLSDQALMRRTAGAVMRQAGLPAATGLVVPRREP